MGLCFTKQASTLIQQRPLDELANPQWALFPAGEGPIATTGREDFRSGLCATEGSGEGQ